MNLLTLESSETFIFVSPIKTKKSWALLVKAGFNTCVSRTRNNGRCLSIYRHQCSQAVPAFATKACVLATKSHMLNFCEACVAICCECDLWQPIMQVTKRFSVRKKSKTQNKKNITTTSGKSLFLTQYQMRYAIYITPNAKDLVTNLTMIAYGNRQKAITFAWANNSDLLRALNHLMETSY